PDGEGKNVVFRRVYDRIIFDQTLSLLNDPAIIRQQLLIRRNRVGPGDSTTLKRLVQITVQYETAIDHNETTDLEGKWKNTIKPFIIKQIKNILGTIKGALIDEEPEFDLHENRIAATMQFAGLDTGSSGFLEFTLTTEERSESGLTLVPVWSGNALSKYVFPGPARRILTKTQVFRA
ncbi:MAG: hypothetical protein GTN64_07530, partial [Candidatus Latescibacteria bacterium]|nr:hypothetical protein [Candidatus Latescibacterota bacterium]NIO78453.1 hypothetical protein [Candidatus Latescibacterota bacterium]